MSNPSVALAPSKVSVLETSNQRISRFIDEINALPKRERAFIIGEVYSRLFLETKEDDDGMRRDFVAGMAFCKRITSDSDAAATELSKGAVQAGVASILGSKTGFSGPERALVAAVSLKYEGAEEFMAKDITDENNRFEAVYISNITSTVGATVREGWLEKLERPGSHGKFSVTAGGIAMFRVLCHRVVSASSQTAVAKEVA